MRQQYKETIKIPEGVSCKFENGVIACSKGSHAISKGINIPDSEIHIKDNEIHFTSKKANKSIINVMKSYAAHMKNMFNGLEKAYSYRMEICNVHFPMTVKVEGNKLVINNFLGEKKMRVAEIVHGVTVTVKGSEIIVAGIDKDAVGQTAANIEYTTKVKKRDRRVFQDGIFITHKNGEAI